MKAIATFLFVTLFLPNGNSGSAFPVGGAPPVATIQQQHNKVYHKATKYHQRDNDPFFTISGRRNTKNTQLQAMPTSAAAVAVSILRGGAETALDLGREGYHLQSLATYGTVTALIMNAALRLYSSTKFPKDRENMIQHIESVFTGTTAICIVSGAFTAVLFNILGIYSKSALGMANYAGYKLFSAATANYCRWGFRAFLTTCMSFVASFCLSLYARIEKEHDDVYGYIILFGSIILALFASYHIQQVLGLATKFIFTPEFMNH